MPYSPIGLSVGDSYTRCKSILIENPYGIDPSIHFIEQEATLTESGADTSDTGRIVVGYHPEKVIYLIDPTTGSPTGETMTHGQVYQAIFSAYLAEAANRDSL